MKIKSRLQQFWIAAATLLVIVVLSGCAGSSTEKSDEGEYAVVVTTTTEHSDAPPSADAPLDVVSDGSVTTSSVRRERAAKGMTTDGMITTLSGTSAAPMMAVEGGGARTASMSASYALAAEGSGESALTMARVAPMTTGKGTELSTKDVSLSVRSDRDKVAGDVAADEDDMDEVMEEPEVAPEPDPRAGQLTAGEWSDLTEWNYWTSIITANAWKGMKDYWGLGKGIRISIRVDNGTDPIPDAEVTLSDKSGRLLWTARTDNFGRAELFTGLDNEGPRPPYDIVVKAGGKETKLGSYDPSREQAPGESPVIARLAIPTPSVKTVDVMFAIDATGSMGDELNYIKSELASVVTRVRKDLGEGYVLRLGANVYRDEGDDYLIHTQKFTENVEEMIGFLKAQNAGGGGDTPEAVEVSLEDAIEKHEWSPSAQSRFIFLVLDAPPHYTPERLEKIRNLITSAAAKGIRIIPVASSGVDKETEFLMRFLGIHTGGTYTFLTDHSGIGNGHIEPTIGSYDVEFLDDLIVRLIVQFTERPASLEAIGPRKPEIH